MSVDQSNALSVSLTRTENLVLYVSQEESPTCISICKTCTIWQAQLSNVSIMLMSGIMKTVESLAGESSVLAVRLFFFFHCLMNFSVILSVVTHRLNSVCLSGCLSVFLKSYLNRKKVMCRYMRQ